MAEKKNEGKHDPERSEGSYGAKHTKSPTTRISKEEVESVAGKLSAFAKDLPQQERDVLGWILTRAQAAPPAEMAAAAAAAAPQVSGLRTSLATQLARSVGFGIGGVAKPEITVVVGWQYRFGFEGGEGEVINPATRTGQ
jgi:hypothetical protein